MASKALQDLQNEPSCVFVAAALRINDKTRNFGLLILVAPDADRTPIKAKLTEEGIPFEFDVWPTCFASGKTHLDNLILFIADGATAEAVVAELEWLTSRYKPETVDLRAGTERIYLTKNDFQRRGTAQLLENVKCLFNRSEERTSAKQEARFRQHLPAAISRLEGLVIELKASLGDGRPVEGLTWNWHCLALRRTGLTVEAYFNDEKPVPSAPSKEQSGF
jgi:hypothetical protein